HAPIQPAPRAGPASASLARELQEAQGGARGDLRAQPPPAASGRSPQAREEEVMIDPRRAQLCFGDKLIAEEVDGLYEEWRVHADEVLADDQIVMAAYEALSKRHLLSRTRGRRGFSAEVVVRLLVLKHARNWSYAVLEREVRANLIYRKFTRVGFAKM